MAHSKFYTSGLGLCLAATLILATPLHASAQTQEDLQPTSIKDNAALWYWQAFTQMQGMDLKELYQDWPPSINPDKVRPWPVEDQSIILTNLHRGAAQPACAWGTDFQLDGINALLPHLGQARRLARLAGIRAEYYFQQGDADPAVDDLIASMILARHVPNPGVLIDVLVQVSISRLAQQVLEKNLYRLDHEQLLRLQDKLADLPPRKTVAQSIVTEKYVADWLVSRVREDGVESLRDLFEDDALSLEEFEKLIEQTGDSVEEFERLADQMRGYYDQVQRITALDHNELNQAEEMLWEQIAQDHNILAELLLPAGGAARRSELRHEARTTMLHAMIAYQLDGPAAFARITDPYDGQPFEIDIAKSAVTLRSRMPHKDGDPISVTFPGIEMKLPSGQP